jgi:hypothetical protein
MLNLIEMKILNSVTRFFTKHKKNNFEEVNSWALAFLGISSFLMAGYWGLMLSEVVPGFVKAVNKSGISFVAVFWGSVLGFYGIVFWFFGCIATRCHTVIYERWFK